MVTCASYPCDSDEPPRLIILSHLHRTIFMFFVPFVPFLALLAHLYPFWLSHHLERTLIAILYCASLALVISSEVVMRRAGLTTMPWLANRTRCYTAGLALTINIEVVIHALVALIQTWADSTVTGRTDLTGFVHDEEPLLAFYAVSLSITFLALFQIASCTYTSVVSDRMLSHTFLALVSRTGRAESIRTGQTLITIQVVTRQTGSASTPLTCPAIFLRAWNTF